MKIYLRDLTERLVEDWDKFFNDEENVHVSCGDIFELGEPVDAIVSPANSFGFMDGGIDFVYSDKLGWNMSEVLRQQINKNHNGELLVGQAEIVDISATNPDTPVKWLIAAPTMRVPMDVSNTVNPYLAFRAVLLAARAHPEINSILCPGMGTMVGKVLPHACAAQMFSAYRQFNDDSCEFERFPTLGNAYSFHYLMIGKTE